MDDWIKHTNYRGYQPDEQVIKWFWQASAPGLPRKNPACSISPLLGTSRIPVNGFQDLQGSDGPRRFTIKKAGEITQLPKSHTCFSRFDLPRYPTSNKVVLLAAAEQFAEPDSPGPSSVPPGTDLGASVPSPAPDTPLDVIKSVFKTCEIPSPLILATWQSLALTGKLIGMAFRWVCSTLIPKPSCKEDAIVFGTCATSDSADDPQELSSPSYHAKYDSSTFDFSNHSAIRRPSSPGAASSNGREPVKIIFMPPAGNASTADSGSTLLSPLEVCENQVPMRTCDLTPGANHQVTTGSAPALDAANPLEPAPTHSQSTLAASQSHASDPQAACDSSRKKKLDEPMTGIEVFRRPISKKGLLRNIDQLEILKDEMELNEGLAHIARKAVNNSPLFLPIVKEVIAYRVKNCFDNGGFRVGTFKLKRSSPEFLALFEAANTKEFASVIRCSPRLTQIDGDDVFFSNKDLIDFDSIAELAKAKKNPEIDASWRSLIALMQRSKTSENEEYSPQEQGMKLSVGKVHTLLQSCIGQIASGCKPVVEAAPSADDTIAGGLKIMCEKASHFRAGAQGTSNHRGNAAAAQEMRPDGPGDGLDAKSEALF
ncbi:hypothetical protein PtA15_14A415 [Puccinia triticina]|uniref:HECT-type E3 ubiquitin transferase n=1 Tax=Puccinia triticina TaxID=208348 RepID=A0ABY7D2A5_9BASI|nr:uncharacterized protein PtA15_14A415 [Puccinia triticina]WAQ91531.1 hypothetical protein PtA15_14A415 [Puccinia triticina]